MPKRLVELYSYPDLETPRRRANLGYSRSSGDILGYGTECLSVNRVYLDDQVNPYAFKQMIDLNRICQATEAEWFLRYAGIPVPPEFYSLRTVRRPDVQGILMTDLTNNWRNLFINSNVTNYSQTTRRWSEANPDLFQKFVDLEPNDPEVYGQLDFQAEQIAKQAAENDILIHHADTVSVVMSEAGIKVMITDMGHVYPYTNRHKNKLFANNLELVSLGLIAFTDFHSRVSRTIEFCK